MFNFQYSSKKSLSTQFFIGVLEIKMMAEYLILDMRFDHFSLLLINAICPW